MSLDNRTEIVLLNLATVKCGTAKGSVQKFKNTWLSIISTKAKKAGQFFLILKCLFFSIKKKGLKGLSIITQILGEFSSPPQRETKITEAWTYRRHRKQSQQWLWLTKGTGDNRHRSQDSPKAQKKDNRCRRQRKHRPGLSKGKEDKDNRG